MLALTLKRHERVRLSRGDQVAWVTLDKVLAMAFAVRFRIQVGGRTFTAIARRGQPVSFLLEPVFVTLLIDVLDSHNQVKVAFDAPASVRILRESCLLSEPQPAGGAL